MSAPGLRTHHPDGPTDLGSAFGGSAAESLHGLLARRRAPVRAVEDEPGHTDPSDAGVGTEGPGTAGEAFADETADRPAGADADTGAGAGDTEVGIDADVVDTDADVTDADVTEADVTEADVTEADVTEADVTEADVTEADVTEADVTEAGVTDTGVTDAGVTDTGVTDTGVTDTGVTDTGVTDTGVTDTGVTDTGVTDTGVTDTGVTDTGVTDTGVTDTGVTDTGVTDTGVTDTGVTDIDTDVADIDTDADETVGDDLSGADDPESDGLGTDDTVARPAGPPREEDDVQLRTRRPARGTAGPSRTGPSTRRRSRTGTSVPGTARGRVAGLTVRDRRDVDLLLLAAAREGAANGREFRDIVQARSGGVFALSERSVYHELHRLKKNRLISDVGPGDPRRFRLTPLGERILTTRLRERERFSHGLGRLLGTDDS